MKNLWKVALGAAALAVVVSNVFTIAIMSVAWWFLARKRLEAWERALSEAGFSVETKMTGPQYQVVARRGRFVVTAARGFRLDTSPLVNEVTVEAPDLPVALDARQRHGDEPGGVVTGDDWFDERVVVQGPVDEALASLDRAGRLALDRVVRLWGGRLRPGAVVLEKPGGTHAAETLVERVEDAIRIADELSLHERTLAEALADNAIREGSDGVRLRNLKALLRRHRGPVATETAKQSLTSPDPRARLVAADHLGEDGYPTLHALLRDTGLDPEIRMQALDVLLDKGAAPAALSTALSDLADTADDRLALTVAGRLGEAASPAAEPALLALLRRRDTAVKLAATHALARSGTLLAIEHLEPLTTGFFTSSALKEAARTTIEQIRARGSINEAGGLSLVAAGPEGALSLSEDAGHVSLVDDPELVPE